MAPRSRDSCALEKDEEKTLPSQDVETAELESITGMEGCLRKIAAFGIETRGSSPVPLAERTNTVTINLFTLWFTMSLNLLP